MVDVSTEPGRGRGPEVSARGGPPGYAALVEAVAVLQHPERAIVRVEGPRALRMLDGLLTNSLGPLERGRAVYAFILTPKGRPVAEARAIGVEDEVWLDVPLACRDSLAAHLERYLPPIHARWRVDEEMGRLSVVGPRVDEIPAAAFGVGAEDPAPETPEDLLVVPGGAGAPLRVRRERIEGPGWDLYAPAARLEALLPGLLEAAARLGGGAASPEAHRIWRVERGIPAYGAEITTDVLPQETGQASRAISFDKGCYTGQEVVARIHYRGHVNRHLRGLRFAGGGEGDAGPPGEGDELFRGEKGVGRVTTAVRSPRFGPIALGYVRREVEPGERLAARPDADPSVDVAELPFTIE